MGTPDLRGKDKCVSYLHTGAQQEIYQCWYVGVYDSFTQEDM